MAVDHLRAGPLSLMPLYDLQHPGEGLSSGVAEGSRRLWGWPSSALTALRSVAPGALSLGLTGQVMSR